MIEIKGKYNTAKVFTDNVDEASKEQILTLCNQSFAEGSVIRLMPDVHAGKGCTIGTTMTIGGKIVPNLVGVDIGCGMETVKIAECEIDFAALDTLIRREIPCGREIRNTKHALNSKIDLTSLRCVSEVNLVRTRRSIGTLGGGNHFIELDKNDDGELYLIVHSGSRHIGSEVAGWYQDEAYRFLSGCSKKQIADTIAALKAAGRGGEIPETVKRLKKSATDEIPKELAYVSGELFDDYIHDMKLIQHFAMLNRQAMIEVILCGMRLTEVERFTTIHNYIDTDSMMLRKGAVSAKLGERLLIPINMRDGSLVCEGLGNPDWNYSAPHGAGRVMSRKKAFADLNMDEFIASMQNIYSSTVNKNTLDESPMAYKNMDEIIANIGPAVKILKVIKPVYNFKAAE